MRVGTVTLPPDDPPPPPTGCPLPTCKVLLNFEISTLLIIVVDVPPWKNKTDQTFKAEFILPKVAILAFPVP